MTKYNDTAGWSCLTQLLDARGPSGFEDNVQATFVRSATAMGLSTETDVYGNAWATLGPVDAPAILIMGHGDEIGLMVHHIDSKGFVRVRAIGGVDPATLIARRVTVRATDGSEHRAVVGSVPIHLQDGDKKSPKLWDLWLDLGCTSAEQVADLNIRVGCYATLVESWEQVGNRVIARALDNRVGVFTALETLRILQANSQLPDNLRFVAVSTIQEEIGAIGAQMVARTLQPVACFVVDVTHATDVPSLSTTRFGEVTLGGGPTITHGSANHRGLLAALERAAGNESIKLQHEASSRNTGTDADNVYKMLGGIASAVISIPNRYMHTTAEMIDVDDLFNTPKLLAATAISLTESDWGCQLKV